ncbi:MAG: hypothetical protein R2752_19610 [Vicinamibacterales bacterium]
MTLTILLVALLVSAGQATTTRPDPLAEARAHYNAGRFDEAAASAIEALALPGLGDVARVVLARAELERYRESREGGSLDAAREALKAVHADALLPRDRVEYLVGVGEALYLDDPPRFGAAAEYFELALDAPVPQSPGERERVFEWWASALDREAQFGPAASRQAVYERIHRGALAEREAHESSAVVWYWLALSARGAGDLDRAWAHAVAGWIHGAQLGARGTQLRADLDRLVTQVILPQRARQLAASDGDPREALAALAAQWDEIKRKWG